jgi:hypothetical protein
MCKGLCLLWLVPVSLVSIVYGRLVPVSLVSIVYGSFPVQPVPLRVDRARDCWQLRIWSWQRLRKACTRTGNCTKHKT